ncbi:MAG: outer membrane protein transport protein [Gammaproteobacteria bacterium]|nr:outer membrane protein transport protein [Gammaproteobacteria bacterium]
MNKLNVFSRQFYIYFLLTVMSVMLGSAAHATVGYFALGYGAKSNSMAGATVAAPQDAMAGAVNPAGMAWVGERVDLSLKAFHPKRDAEFDTRVVGAQFTVESDSKKTWLFIPGAGATYQVNDDLWLGFTFYANGGLNTDYSSNLYDQSIAVLGAFGQAGGGANGFEAASNVPSGTVTGSPDTGQLGVDFAQVVLAPTLSYKVDSKLTLGLSPLLAAQRFQARGLGNFQCFTTTGFSQNQAACSPGGAGPLTPGFQGSGNLTDNGHNWSYGIGVRVGFLAEIIPQVQIGGAYSSKIYMSKFSDYRDLFAESGRLDAPSHFQVGISVKPIDSLQLTFDYQRIFYSDVKSIGNSGPIASATGPTLPAGVGLLGANNGLGFGWNDINIFRIGLSCQVNDQIALRAGYSWNDDPIPNNQVLLNILAPATITRHATAGISYSPATNHQLHLTYEHAFHENQKQQVSAFGIPVSTSMYQQTVQVGYTFQY